MARALPLVAIASVAASCASHDDPPARRFPDGFLWGVATAAQGNAPPAGMAQNAYALYDTDSENAAALGANSFQLTIEWARLVPNEPADPTAPLTAADVDAKEVAHYHAVLASLHAHGLEPVVTVTHFSLPTWVDDPAAYDETSKTFTDGSLGGWTSEVTGVALGRYAEFLAKEFPEVHVWLTMDEPIVALVAGYMAGSFPPGFSELSMNATTLANGASPKSVLVHMIDGHARAYHAIKAVRPDARVSFAKNSVMWDPADPTNPDDVVAAARLDHAYNLVFLDALAQGDFDTSLVGTGPVEHHADWAGTLDFIGVNYYDRDAVVAKPGLFPPLDAVPCAPAFKDVLPSAFALLGCPDEDQPGEEQGMTKILLEYEARYHLPQLVTESGFIDTPEGKSKKLVQILQAVADGIAGGANVFGYTYWTLNYDYEWNDGWSQNMGLYTVKGFGDGDMPGGAPGPSTDFTRVPLHPFVDVFTEIARGNTVPSHLIGQYGAP